MNVKFKDSIGIVYKVLNSSFDFCENKKEYCLHYELQILGNVPVWMLEETDEEPNAVDLAINLTLINSNS